MDYYKRLPNRGMAVIVTSNFCVNCGTTDIGPDEQLCEVCQAAIDLTDLLRQSRREQRKVVKL